jgi:hypothetical protein
MLYKFDGFVFTDEFDPAFPGYKKKGRYVPLHNYIYWLNTGLIPEKGKTAIHHIDEDRENNEFENLELISVKEHNKIHNQNPSLKHRAQISLNRKESGLFGFKGVRYHKRNIPWNKVWQSVIQFNNRKHSLGYFNDPLSGEIVYKIVQKEIY